MCPSFWHFLFIGWNVFNNLPDSAETSFSSPRSGLGSQGESAPEWHHKIYNQNRDDMDSEDYDANQSTWFELALILCSKCF